MIIKPAKIFIFAAIAAIQLSSATRVFAEEAQLFSADEWAQADGLTLEDDAAIEEQSDAFFPPHHPRPRPPQPPHHHPRPQPRPPVQPGPPHYAPPPPYYPTYECGSEDLYGRTYWQRSTDPRWAQADVHQYCVMRSNGPCRDLGCRAW